MKMRTIGWDRVDAFGRGGNDKAYLRDTVGDDHFYVFAEFSIMQSDHLYAVIKDFEHAEAESKNGGFDRVYFKQLVGAEHVFADAAIATLTGPTRSVWARHFDNLELDKEDGEEPSLDLRAPEFPIRFDLT